MINKIKASKQVIYFTFFSVVIPLAFFVGASIKKGGAPILNALVFTLATSLLMAVIATPVIINFIPMFKIMYKENLNKLTKEEDNELSK